MIRFLAALLLLLPLSACIPVSTIPIGSVPFEPTAATGHQTLVVLLPGRGSTASSFAEEGLVRELKRRRPEVDIVGVEAHLGYYRDRTLLARIREDIVAPARMKGYRQIWLVGISLGGLGAALYDAAYPGEVTGIGMLAPYLGEGYLLEEIERAGGLAKWRPVPVAGDVDQEIWQQLASYADASRSDGRVFLGFGTEDRFAAINRFFGALLPSGQVVSTPGGHDWQTWRKLWDAMLADPRFAASAPPEQARRP